MLQPMGPMWSMCLNSLVLGGAITPAQMGLRLLTTHIPGPSCHRPGPLPSLMKMPDHLCSVCSCLSSTARKRHLQGWVEEAPA
jgi:hypothetical protein